MNWLFRLFFPRPYCPHFVDATIKEQTPPGERRKRYEKPLSKALEKKNLGYVSGGGTLLSPRPQPGEQDISCISIDVELVNLEDALELTKEVLTDLGAPCGSKLLYKDRDGIRQDLPLGDLEVVSLFADNVSLDLAIYKSTDTNKLIAGFKRAMRDGDKTVGEVYGPYAWPSEVLFYFKGPDADLIFDRIKPLPRKFPVLQNARIVFQRRDPEKGTETLRLPFNIQP